MSKENETKKKPDKTIMIKHVFSKAKNEGEGESEPSTTATTLKVVI